MREYRVVGGHAASLLVQARSMPDAVQVVRCMMLQDRASIAQLARGKRRQAIALASMPDSADWPRMRLWREVELGRVLSIVSAGGAEKPRRVRFDVHSRIGGVLPGSDRRNPSGKLPARVKRVGVESSFDAARVSDLRRFPIPCERR